MINLILINSTAEELQIETSVKIVEVIINSIQTVLNRITHAFRGRMGYSPEEVLGLKDKILNQIDIYTNKNKYAKNLIISTNSLSCIITVVFSAEDLIIINECLNEICNGLKIDNFEDEIGISKDSAKNLLAEVNFIIRQK